MAKFLSNGNNDLRNTFNSYMIKSLGCFILVIISILLYPIFKGFSGIAAFIFFIMFSLNLNSGLTYYAGLKGEKTAEKLLANLPDSYSIIPGPRIQVDGKESEMDHIILGPNGIFVVESKNHNGRIVGSESDHKLTQHKVGQKGGKYINNFYNPIKQVNTQVYRLSQLLKNNGYGYWIQGIVLFTNKKAKVKVHSLKTPVFHLKRRRTNEILDYITSYQARKTLSQEEIKKISLLINQASKNGMNREEFRKLLA